MFFRQLISIKFKDGETEENTHIQPHPQYNSALIQHIPLPLLLLPCPLIPHQYVNSMLWTLSLLFKHFPQSLNGAKTMLHYRCYVWK